MDPIFARLPAKPDHPPLELEVLEFWERRRTFERLRERNRGGPKWSFVDGPVTANKVLAVHTAWGRTLKDVFQRYKAMNGFDQRFQNGFDCRASGSRSVWSASLASTPSERWRPTGWPSSRGAAARR